MKEGAAAARKRMLSLPNVTEGHEYGKWWLCIVFAPGTSETEPRRLHWCYNQKGAEDFARDYTERGCFCVIAQTTKQPGDDSRANEAWRETAGPQRKRESYVTVRTHAYARAFGRLTRRTPRHYLFGDRQVFQEASRCCIAGCSQYYR